MNLERNRERSNSNEGTSRVTNVRNKSARNALSAFRTFLKRTNVHGHVFI